MIIKETYTSGAENKNRNDIEKKVWEILRQCYDPEIPVNIVDLGLVYNVKVEDKSGLVNVKIRMTLTAPGCPLASYMLADVERRIQQLDGVNNVEIELVFDPPWNSSMMSDSAKAILNFP